MSQRDLVKQTANKKGTRAALVGIASLVGSLILLKITFILCLTGLVIGGFFTVRLVQDWFAYRKENGLYF